MDAQGELYSVLCDMKCYCGYDMEDGTLIRFPSPCWVHPICSKCYFKWGGNLAGGTCPICRAEYDGNSVEVKLELWPNRGARAYPPFVDDEPTVPLHLVEHKADCCEFGYEYGDYVVYRFCDSETDHFMHSWCFLTRALYVDDGSLQRAPPFHCSTCEEIGIFNNFHDGTMIFSLKIDVDWDNTLTGEEEAGINTSIDEEDQEDTYSDVEDDYETDGGSDD